MKTKEYIEVPKLGIKITKEQQFNGMTYENILKKVDESKIATYDILKKLRNISFESNWEKYSFMRDFWTFVPNEDKASVENGKVARFVAYSDYCVLYCNWDSGGSYSGLGVFLIEKLEKKK